MSSLRDQLERFHGAITGFSTLDTARDLVERGEIDELARLRVYEHAYTARIASVLVHDYPKLAHLAGEAELRSWTTDYLRAYPPSNFSLREVGAHLARWISARDRSFLPSEVARVGADLARLERARTEVFDGPDATPLTRDDLASMDPAEFPSLALRLVPSSRVVALETNADDVWDAIENERDVPEAMSGGRTESGSEGDGPLQHVVLESERDGSEGDGPLQRVVLESERDGSEGDGPQRVVLVWRRELAVIHRTLDDDEARIVPTMIAGTTFGAACDVLDEATAAERAIELLVRWLDAQILQR